MREELIAPIHSAASESSYRGRIPQKVLMHRPGTFNCIYFPRHDDCPAPRCRTFWRAAQMSVAAQIGFYVATTLTDYLYTPFISPGFWSAVTCHHFVFDRGEKSGDESPHSKTKPEWR